MLPKFDLQLRWSLNGSLRLKLLLELHQLLVDALVVLSVGWNTPYLGIRKRRKRRLLGLAYLGGSLLLLVVVLLHEQALVQLLQLAYVVAIAHLHRGLKRRERRLVV